MPSTRAKKKLIKGRISSVARVIACVSFLVLTIIGVSSLVRAMSLTTIANEDGIPSIWDVASLGSPDTITVPVELWDQRQDDCDDPNRQFEWVICGYWTKGALQGVIKDHLGADGFPIPTFTNSKDAWNTNYDVFTANVTGHDPVLPTDNYYRWWHDTTNTANPVSKHYDSEITFTKVPGTTNTYKFGRDGTFPLDGPEYTFSDEDSATKQGHNYHFTSRLHIPIKVSESGREVFTFSGDDDVWVFLNNKLALDIGGLHEKLEASFTINPDGTLTTKVQNVNQDLAGRAQLGYPSNDYNSYVNPLNEYIMARYKTVTKTIDVGLTPGAVVNLDVFYAERSTTESNVNVTIANMTWPISADSDVRAKVVGKVDDTTSNLVQINTSVTNRDPSAGLVLERLAAFIREDAEDGIQEGFLPLDSTTIEYSYTPDDPDSWQPLEITLPSNTADGFNLIHPLTMNPYGEERDTIYFRFFTTTSEYSGTMKSVVSYYTTLNGAAGFTYDYDSVKYTGATKPTPHQVNITYVYDEDDSEAHPPYSGTFNTGDNFDITSPEIDGYVPDVITVSGTMGNEDVSYVVRYKRIEDVEPGTPEVPETPNTPTTPGGTTPSNPEEPKLPGSDILDDMFDWAPPLGEVAYIPNTGVINDAVAAVFEYYFAEAIMSQGFIMGVLLIFAGSFATWFSLRKYAMPAPAMRSAGRGKYPKMPANMAKAKKTAAVRKSSMKSAKTVKKSSNTAKKRK